MVSPFTLSSRYTFMGTCEHILLQSCPPETAEVFVVADFITDSMENGAIGIFILSVQLIAYYYDIEVFFYLVNFQCVVILIVLVDCDYANASVLNQGFTTCTNMLLG